MRLRLASGASDQIKSHTDNDAGHFPVQLHLTASPLRKSNPSATSAGRMTVLSFPWPTAPAVRKLLRIEFEAPVCVTPVLNLFRDHQDRQNSIKSPQEN